LPSLAPPQPPPGLHIDLSPIDHDVEEKRQRLVANRGKRFIGPDGLVQKFENSGDPLFELHEIAALVIIVAGPDLSYQRIVERFKASVAFGSFGFRYYGDRRAVRDLVDLHNYNQFPAGQYPLRPSTLTVEASPQLMRARRSVWVRWLTALGWPVPPELQPGTADADYGGPGAEYAAVVDDGEDDDEGELCAPPPSPAVHQIRILDAQMLLGVGSPLLNKKKVVEQVWKAGLTRTRREAEAAFVVAVPADRRRAKQGRPPKV
jgi:hypothetical protein